jgi:hypothetical protein
LTLAGQVTAQTTGCVATADLPSTVLGFHDLIRITHQQAQTEAYGENNTGIRVVNKEGQLLGIEIPLTLKPNESRILSIEEIYKLAQRNVFKVRLSPNVVQIIEDNSNAGPHHDFQATYRNSLGGITPLMFTCDAGPSG